MAATTPCSSAARWPGFTTRPPRRPQASGSRLRRRRWQPSPGKRNRRAWTWWTSTKRTSPPSRTKWRRRDASAFLEVNPEAKMKAVLEISNNLAGTVDLSALLPKILDSLFGIFRCADRGCILLKDDATNQLVPRDRRHQHSLDDVRSPVELGRPGAKHPDHRLAEHAGAVHSRGSGHFDDRNNEHMCDTNVEGQKRAAGSPSDGQAVAGRCPSPCPRLPTK